MLAAIKRILLAVNTMIIFLKKNMYNTSWNGHWQTSSIIWILETTVVVCTIAFITTKHRKNASTGTRCHALSLYIITGLPTHKLPKALKKF